MLEIYIFVVILCNSFFPLIRLMTDKLMALFKGTKGEQSLRKRNLLKIIVE